MANYPAARGRELTLALVDTIEANKGYLSEVDGAIGDGDHGINMGKGFGQAKTALGEREVPVSEGLALIGRTLMTNIGGAMGPIYGTFFVQMSLKSKGKETIDPATLDEMLTAARKGVEDLAGAKVGDKTIIDALAPAQEALHEAVGRGEDLSAAVRAMAEAAEEGKESTRGLVAKLGRASRLGERSRGILDAGATSCALLLNTFAKTLTEQNL